MKGVYINGWSSGSTKKLDKLIKLADNTEINSFVMDIKDASGNTYLTMNPNLPATLAKLKQHNIYPIARIVVFFDPHLVKVKPHLAAKKSNGTSWTDRRGVGWLSPFQKEVWEYNLALAKKAVDMGFTEIQWDYVRFPDITQSQRKAIKYPGDNGKSEEQVITEFLQYSKQQLGKDILVTADVFGYITTYSGYNTIGQQWETMLDNVDSIHPMVYPSHYAKGSFGLASPNANPYTVINKSMSSALKRSKGQEHKIRPWLQAFSLGSPVYTEYHIRQQIQAAKDLGINEYLLWNPGSKYEMSTK